MKKILCLALVIMMLLMSVAIAENTSVQYGNWKVQSYVDEFKMPTGQYFAVTTARGTFDNSAVNDEFLGVQIRCELAKNGQDYLIGFVLFEYGDHKVLNNSTRNNKTYNMVMLDSQGQKHYFDGIQPPQYTIILPEDEKVVFDAFMKGGTVRFYVEDAERTSNNYSFMLEDVTGFDKAVEMLNGK